MRRRLSVLAPNLKTSLLREGALDDLLEHYCQNLEKVGGYLTSDGDVDMERVAYILYLVGTQEEKLLSVGSSPSIPVPLLCPPGLRASVFSVLSEEDPPIIHTMPDRWLCGDQPSCKTRHHETGEPCLHLQPLPPPPKFARKEGRGARAAGAKVTVPHLTNCGQVCEGPNEPAKFGKVAKNQNFGRSAG